ncbi:hypothetical protein [Polynucleobacter sp. AP-Melu-500A-A1]|uniref:hypothetical protein n=1 Tax=Polynucleobacter sp. AP-Melu-500A-A1 TaxID=2576929 RepID=UPI001C0B62F7|nr:hypothetical protein [Polynucleobacter sp. AP-Melu-500A-A1]MBU3630098.1 hypothetical protein [Polynucleobacter sp. AP-Melu-500A-A1]
MSANTRSLSSSKNTQSASRIWALWLLLGLGCATVMSLAPVSALLNLFHDDSFFYMVIARNHADGLGYSFDGLNQTNGFHLLWLWLLSVVGSVIALTGEQGIRIVVMLQNLLSIGAALIYVRLLAHAQVKTLFLILFYFAYLFLCTFADIGQESALFGFLFAVLINTVIPILSPVSVTSRSANQSLVVSLPSRMRFILVGVVSALIVLSRLDAFFILGGVALALWILGQKKMAYILVVGVALGIAATMSFNYTHFGHIYSVSSWLKSGFDLEKLRQIFIPGLCLRVLVVLGLLLAALLNYRSITQLKGEISLLPRSLILAKFETLPWPFILTLSALLAYSAYFLVLFLEVSALGSWYFNQALGFALFLYALSTVRLSPPNLDSSTTSNGQNASQSALSSVWASTPLCGALVLGALLWIFKFGWAHSSDPTKEMGQWLAANTPADAVIFQRDGAGAVSYFASRHIINGDGLVNNMPYQAMLRSGKLCLYLQEQKVQYLVTNVFINQAGLIEDFIYLWTKGVDAIPLTRVSPTKALFASPSAPTYRVFTVADAVTACQ